MPPKKKSSVINIKTNNRGRPKKNVISSVKENNRLTMVTSSNRRNNISPTLKENSRKSKKRLREEDSDNNNNNNNNNNRNDDNNNNNNYNSDESEDITLEQLGKIISPNLPNAPPSNTIYSSHSLPLLSSSSSIIKNTIPAAEFIKEENKRSPSADDAAVSFSHLSTSPNTETRSPARLTTGSNDRTTPILSNINNINNNNMSGRWSTNGVGIGDGGGGFQLHYYREQISCDPENSNSCSKNNNNNNININDSDSIALSPAERPSTTLIRKAAATRPAVSPATLWICLDDDDDEEEEIKVVSCPPSPARPVLNTDNNNNSTIAIPSLTVGETIHSTNSTQLLIPTTPPPQGREPISDVLPPTFRPRKGPLQANKPPPRTNSPLPNGSLIFDDDFTSEDDDKEEEEKEKNKFHNNSKNGLHSNLLDVTNTSETSLMTLPFMSGRIYLKDDDNSSTSSSRLSDIKDDDEEEGDVNNSSLDATQVMIRETKEEENNNNNNRPQSAFSLAVTLPPDNEISVASFKTGIGSPTRSVRDFLFSSRRPSSVDLGETSFNSFNTTTGFGLGLNTAAEASSSSVFALGGPDISNSTLTRPVEKLRPLFNKKFTRKSFLNTVEDVVSKLHCLEAGEFWQAFETAEYVGEGSFGIVWRCKTIDGDLVAVKSCPISFHSRASIDDAFSVLREVAIMRFLSEHEVPYVLPLHSAFFVQSREVLPPDVIAAVNWRSRLTQMKKEKERQRQKLEKQKLKRRGKQQQHNLESLDKIINNNNNNNKEEENIEQETAEEMAERLQHEKVRFPRFLSISVEDAMECDATIFLVTELCDGDLESIERHDSISKGVAFCVGSALAAMHRLGLVHLDLKPSNVLFAYENSPSQQHQIQKQQQQQQQLLLSSTVMNAASTLSQNTQCSPPAATRLGNSSTPSSVKFYLSDFGNCRIVGPNITDEVTGVFGTLEYMDSRALQDKTCSRATDCFSLGATLYELLYSKRLYPPCKNPKCASDEDHTRHCYVEAAQQPVILPPANTILQKVTAGLLALDTNERWTAERCRSFFLIHGIAGTGTSTTPP